MTEAVTAALLLKHGAVQIGVGCGGPATNEMCYNAVSSGEGGRWVSLDRTSAIMSAPAANTPHHGE